VELGSSNLPFETAGAYAEQNGPDYAWENTRLLAPNHYEIVDVRTSRVCGRQCCFQRRSCKRSSRPTLRYARCWRSTRAMAGEAGGEAKAIAIMKNGAALLLGGSRPEGRRKCSMRSTRSVTQSRAIRSNKIIRSFAILNNVPRYLLIPLLGVNLSDERSEDQQQSSDQNS
jgi:hypothetical protein